MANTQLVNQTGTPNKKAKNRGGRPELSDDEFRAFSIKTGFNQHEFNTFMARAESVGLSETPAQRAKFIRKLLLNQPIASVSSINREALTMLNRINGNLNKISMHHQISIQDYAEINDFKAKVADMASKLLGVQESEKDDSENG